jgi:hypothetical protein
VVPAADRVGRKALDLAGELYAAVQALVADAEHPAADALEKDALAQELHRSNLLFRDLARQQGGVPVIAEAVPRGDILAPRNLVEDLARDNTFAVAHPCSQAALCLPKMSDILA